MADGMQMDDGSDQLDGPLNFYCRLPAEKAKAPNRAASPASMTWLTRILNSYDQDTDQIGGEGGAPNRHAAASGSLSGRLHMTNSTAHSSKASSPSQHSREPSAAEVSAANGATISDGGRGKPSEAHLLDGSSSSAEEEEEPWFSQLVHLPQVRSAGVPFATPTPSMQKRPRDVVAGRKVDPKRPLGGSEAMQSSTSVHSHFPSSSANPPLDFVRSPSTTSVGMTDSMIGTAPTVAGAVTSSVAAASTATVSASPMLPPDNFAMVNAWVYRSSFPKKRHFPFIKTLGLRSVLTLILEEYPEQNTNFLDDNGITFFQFGIPGNKEPFVQIPQDKITAALVTILDRRNHPMLIHCNKGKHRTGCLIGCLRKVQQWSLTTIFDEYRRFSFPKSRSMDQEFIELYREMLVWSQVERRWLPRWGMLGKRLGSIVDKEEEEKEKEEIFVLATGAARAVASATDAANRIASVRLGQARLRITEGAA